MSTAARPTYFAAIGRSTHGGVASRHISGKDQTAHTKLKYRVIGQASVSEMKEKNLKVSINLQESIYLRICYYVSLHKSAKRHKLDLIDHLRY